MSSSAPAQRPVLSVAELNRRVRDCLENNFPLAWIGGEISNLTYAASGHVYFSLKDASAQVRCVMWRSRAQTLGWRLENGQKIEARALVSFYEPRGEFQLNVEAIRQAGQGDLYERFLRLKAQLEAEGLFAPDGKRPLPAFPRHLAIVTSPQAAALRDVLSTLRRRAPHIALTLIPTAVQGDGAAERIAAALGQVGQTPAEAVILCRGGGSIEDLWSFNEEVVARAIRACPVPVVSGVGHETDFTIADFAADLRAATPTAAAEQIAPDRQALLDRIEALGLHLARRVDRLLADRQQQLDWLGARLTHPAERLRQQGQAVDQLGRRLQLGLGRLRQHSQQRLSAARQALFAVRPSTQRQHERLQHLHYRLDQHTRWQISDRSGKLNALGKSLSQLDPHAVLARGYAIAFGPDGRAVRNAAELGQGDAIQLSFARGSASAVIAEVVAAPEAE